MVRQGIMLAGEMERPVLIQSMLPFAERLTFGAAALPPGPASEKALLLTVSVHGDLLLALDRRVDALRAGGGTAMVDRARRLLAENPGDGDAALAVARLLATAGAARVWTPASQEETGAGLDMLLQSVAIVRRVLESDPRAAGACEQFAIAVQRAIAALTSAGRADEAMALRHELIAACERVPERPQVLLPVLAEETAALAAALAGTDREASKSFARRGAEALRMVAATRPLSSAEQLLARRLADASR